MQPGPRELYVSDRTASRQVSANQHRIFCFNCDIKFPIADWRVRERKLRTLRWRFGRWSAWQADWDEVDILQNVTICHCNVAADGCGRERSGHFDVCVRAGGERIVSRNQHAVGLQL